MAEPEPFVLLDDARVEGASDAQLFEHPSRVFVARRPEEVLPALEAAVANFRQELVLCPECLGAWDLADALEKLGRPCEAIPPLQTLVRLNARVDERRVQARIADLMARGNCESDLGQGSAKIP